MTEPTRRETQLGLADLTNRLKTAGVPIAEQRIDDFRSEELLRGWDSEASS